MKHTHHIIRLLTLAVVSCALAALLSGCTKEEFIAGYNEFMFGDWFPTYGSTSQSGTSYDPDHVYDPPNPECDAKISSLLSQLYSLESSARSAVSSAISAAKDEYHSLPAEERTFANKVSIAYKHLSSVESTYDTFRLRISRTILRHSTSLTATAVVTLLRTRNWFISWLPRLRRALNGCRIWALSSIRTQKAT